MTVVPPAPREPGGRALDHPEPDEAGSVRPYMVTGGRTRPSGDALPIEALVECLLPAADAESSRPRGAAGPSTPSGPESRRILELTQGRYLSVAEISAHAHLPVGVVRVLVSDLAAAGSVRIHGLTPASLTDPADPTGGAAALSVLESVLNGISAL